MTPTPPKTGDRFRRGGRNPQGPKTMNESQETVSSGYSRKVVHMDSQQLKQHAQDLCKVMPDKILLRKEEVGIKCHPYLPEGLLTFDSCWEQVIFL